MDESHQTELVGQSEGDSVEKNHFREANFVVQLDDESIKGGDEEWVAGHSCVRKVVEFLGVAKFAPLSSVGFNNDCMIITEVTQRFRVESCRRGVFASGLDEFLLDSYAILPVRA